MSEPTKLDPPAARKVTVQAEGCGGLVLLALAALLFYYWPALWNNRAEMYHRWEVRDAERARELEAARAPKP